MTGYADSYVPAGAAVIRDVTVGAALAEAAAEAPELIALVDGNGALPGRRRWTYAELFALAVQGASALMARFEPGERVAVWAPNSAEWVLLQYSAALAGLTLVPIDPAYRTKELAAVLGQSRAAGIFLVPAYRGTDLAATVAQAQCPTLRQVLYLNEWEELLKTGVPRRRLPTVGPGDAAQIQYVAGAPPRGAVLHHRGMVNNARFIAARFHVEAGDAWLNQMPLFHIAGSQINVLGALAARARQIVCSFEPAQMAALIEQEQVRVMIGAAAMFAKLLDHPDAATRNLRSVRVVAVGGGVRCTPEQAARLERATGATYVNFYGMTETCGMSLQAGLDDSFSDRVGTVGRALPGSEVKVVAPHTNATLPVGAIGEICVRGYQVMSGYFELPEQTALAIDQDGFIHSGDCGAMDSRGMVRLEGSLPDLILRGAEKIDPREIEDLLAKHEAVKQAAVVGLPHPVYGQIVAAAVQLRAGVETNESALSAYCRAQLASYKTPQRFFFVATLPLLPSGKVHQAALREQLSLLGEPPPDRS